MGKGATQKAAETQALESGKAQQQEATQRAQLQREQFDAIKPLATALLSLGIDPAQFLQSPFGQSLFGPAKEAIGQEFDASRVNLEEALASRGISGTGVGAAPLASTFIDQAKASADLFRTIPQLGLNLGLQGANLLQGQQAIFNPTPLFASGGANLASVIGAPRGLSSQIIGAAGTALGGAAQGFAQRQ